MPPDFDPHHNYYDDLKVPFGSNKATVRKAFRDLALKYHPDKNLLTGGDPEKFSIISTAHELLSEDSVRHQFDQLYTPLRSDSKYRPRQPASRAPRATRQQQHDPFPGFGASSGFPQPKAYTSAPRPPRATRTQPPYDRPGHQQPPRREPPPTAKKASKPTNNGPSSFAYTHGSGRRSPPPPPPPQPQKPGFSVHSHEDERHTNFTTSYRSRPREEPRFDYGGPRPNAQQSNSTPHHSSFPGMPSEDNPLPYPNHPSGPHPAQHRARRPSGAKDDPIYAEAGYEKNSRSRHGPSTTKTEPRSDRNGRSSSKPHGNVPNTSENKNNTSSPPLGTSTKPSSQRPSSQSQPESSSTGSKSAKRQDPFGSTVPTATATATATASKATTSFTANPSTAPASGSTNIPGQPSTSVPTFPHPFKPFSFRQQHEPKQPPSVFHESPFSPVTPNAAGPAFRFDWANNFNSFNFGGLSPAPQSDGGKFVFSAGGDGTPGKSPSTNPLHVNVNGDNIPTTSKDDGAGIPSSKGPARQKTSSPAKPAATKSARTKTKGSPSKDATRPGRRNLGATVVDVSDTESVVELLPSPEVRERHSRLARNRHKPQSGAKATTPITPPPTQAPLFSHLQEAEDNRASLDAMDVDEPDEPPIHFNSVPKTPFAQPIPLGGGATDGISTAAVDSGLNMGDFNKVPPLRSVGLDGLVDDLRRVLPFQPLLNPLLKPFWGPLTRIPAMQQSVGAGLPSYGSMGPAHSQNLESGLGVERYTTLLQHLPQPPVGPNVPVQMTPFACQEYGRQRQKYLNVWGQFSASMMLVLSQSQLMTMNAIAAVGGDTTTSSLGGGAKTATTSTATTAATAADVDVVDADENGDYDNDTATTGRAKGLLLDGYLDTLGQDNAVRQYWAVACEQHMMVMMRDSQFRAELWHQQERSSAAA